MRSFLRLLLASILVWAMGAVYSAPLPALPSINVSPDSLSEIKSITIVRPPDPNFYLLLNRGNPGAGFGIFGALGELADKKHKQEALNKALQGLGVAVVPGLGDAIARRLTDLGYAARADDGPWEVVNGFYSFPLDRFKSDADAILMVSPTTVGFVSEGALSNYIPTLTVMVTMVGKDRERVIYKGFHSVGWHPDQAGWRATPANTKFPDFNALVSDPSASAASLRDSWPGIAKTIGEDLKK
jgi:hypothetical protein